MLLLLVFNQNAELLDQKQIPIEEEKRNSFQVFLQGWKAYIRQVTKNEKN